MRCITQMFDHVSSVVANLLVESPASEKNKTEETYGEDCFTFEGLFATPIKTPLPPRMFSWSSAHLLKAYATSTWWPVMERSDLDRYASTADILRRVGSKILMKRGRTLRRKSAPHRSKHALQ